MIPKATITNSTPHQIRNPRYVNLVRTVLTRIIRELNTIIAPRNTTDAKAKKNASSVEEMLLSSVREKGKGMLLVTHNPSFAAKADRIYTLKGGRLE